MRARVALLLAFAPLLSSCTIIGLGVGGFTSRQDTLDPGQERRFTPSTPELPEPGDWVEIELHDGSTLAGSYRGVQYGAFAVETEHGLRPAPFDSVREFRVLRGTYALPGTVIGLIADISVGYYIRSRRLDSGWK